MKHNPSQLDGRAELDTRQSKTANGNCSPMADSSSYGSKGNAYKQNQLQQRYLHAQLTNSKQTANLNKPARTAVKSSNSQNDDLNLSRGSAPGRKKFQGQTSSSITRHRVQSQLRLHAPNELKNISDNGVTVSIDPSVVVNSPERTSVKIFNGSNITSPTTCQPTGNEQKNANLSAQFNQLRFAALQPPSHQSSAESKHEVTFLSKQRSADQTKSPAIISQTKKNDSRLDSPLKNIIAAGNKHRHSAGRIQSGATPKLIKTKKTTQKTNNNEPYNFRENLSYKHLQKQVIGVIKANQSNLAVLTGNIASNSISNKTLPGVQNKNTSKGPTRKTAKKVQSLRSKEVHLQGKRPDVPIMDIEDSITTSLRGKEIQLQGKRPDVPIMDIEDSFVVSMRSKEIHLHGKQPDVPIVDIEDSLVDNNQLEETYRQEITPLPREVYNNLAMQAFARMEKRIINDANKRQSSMLQKQNKSLLPSSSTSNLNAFNRPSLLNKSENPQNPLLQTSSDCFKEQGRPSVVLGEQDPSVMAKEGDSDDVFVDFSVPESGPRQRKVDKRRHTIDQARSMIKDYQRSQKPQKKTADMLRRATNELANLDSTVLQNIKDIQAPIMAAQYQDFDTSEENLLEQTLGQTLRQQKDILDQINHETNQRSHMQLMSKLIGDKPSIIASGVQRMTPRQKTAAASSLLTSIMPKSTQDLPQAENYRPGNSVEFSEPKIMQNVGASSVPVTLQNSPRSQHLAANSSGIISASKINLTYAEKTAADKSKVHVRLESNPSKNSKQEIPPKANTAKTSPRHHVLQQSQKPPMNRVDLQELKKTASEKDDDDNSNQEYAVFEKTLVHNIVPESSTGKKIRPAAAKAQQIRVTSNHKKQPSAISQHVKSSQKSAAPGQVMSQLKDSRSASRLNTGQPLQPGRRDVSGNRLAVAQRDFVGRTVLNRDLSMPRLNARASKPAEELIPLSVPKQQHQISQKGGILYEFNVRLSNLLSLHGPSFLTTQYQSLRVIDIRNNRVTEIPGEICSLNQITHLKLDYNYLQALPFSLGAVRSLVYISTSQNRLQSLPDSLFHKESQLQQLFVNDNKIRELSRGLGKLVHLRTLYLHNNVLVEVPTSLNQLSNLSEFSLDWFLYVEQEEINQQSFSHQKSKQSDIDESIDPSRPTIALQRNESNPTNMLELTKRSAEKTIKTIGEDTRKISQPEDPAGNQGNNAAAPQGNRKVLKGEKGAAVIQEFKLFVKLVDSAQRLLRSEGGVNAYRSVTSTTTQNENIQTGASGFVHFLQFLMYFYRIQRLKDLRNLTYRHKKRHLVHMLAVNGHLYLLKTSIAVLGINRPATSVDLNALDEDNSTALLLAMKQKRFELVKYLLRLPQTRTNIYSIKYGLPMHVALAQAEFKLASKIIKTYFEEPVQADKAFEVDVNVPNEYGNTALHLIFLNFNKAPEKAIMLAKLVIKKGADLQAKNQHQLGVLHLAVQSNNLAAMEFALSHNKKVRARRETRSLKAQTGEFQQKQDYDLFDFDMRGGNQQWSILHHAIYHTNLPMITLLLQCGEFIDLQALDAGGRRAIDLCPYSSPIFKSIRHKTRNQTRSRALQLFKEEKKPIRMNESLNHQVVSTRESAILSPDRHRIEALQKLFILQNLPPEQLRQDVPPGPGPFPQKTLNYNSNTMITENQAAAQPLIGFGGVALTGIQTDIFQEVDKSHTDDIDIVSNIDHHLFIPNALRASDGYQETKIELNLKNVTIDASMNVPYSIDLRTDNPNSTSRLNSQHLKISGVTNINKNDMSNNQLLDSTIRAGGPVSSIKDEDALNMHWQNLIPPNQQVSKPSRRKGRNKKDKDNDAPQPAIQQDDTLYSISESDLLGSNVYGGGVQQNAAATGPQKSASQLNLMIYSTAAAAYPYELQSAAPLQVARSASKNQNAALNEEMSPAKLIATHGQIPSTQKTAGYQLKSANKARFSAKMNNDSEDSADNMNDMDELASGKLSKCQNLQMIKPVCSFKNTEGIMKIMKQPSDGENVEIEEEDEMQTKAFEARESQWNRKLSIKHSEEKRLRQLKTNLSEAIVRSFEEARNYQVQQQQTTPLPPLMNELTLPLADDHKLIQTQVPIMDKSLSSVKKKSPVRKLQEKSPIRFEPSRSGQNLEEILNNDQDEILKPQRSSSLLNTHQLGMGSSPIPANKVTPNAKIPLETSPQSRADILPASQSKHIRQQSSTSKLDSRLCSHNLNLMSTVKVTDLKLHLQQNFTDMCASESGLQGKTTTQDREPEELIEGLLAYTFISENDMAVLLYAQKSTQLKLQESVRQLLNFIEFIATSKFQFGLPMRTQTATLSQTSSEIKLPTLSRLILNLHELQNMIAIKQNEQNQKQQMKFIIINSTGRHRKAPSEFQSAKTIKRHEQPFRQPSMDRFCQHQLGPIINEPSSLHQQPQRKNYREEDSLMMYDSNMTPHSFRNGNKESVRQQPQIQLDQKRLVSSRSTQELRGISQTTTPRLAALPAFKNLKTAPEFINDQAQLPPTQRTNINITSNSFLRRRNSPLQQLYQVSHPVKPSIVQLMEQQNNDADDNDAISLLEAPLSETNMSRIQATQRERSNQNKNMKDLDSRQDRQMNKSLNKDVRNISANSFDRSKIGLEGKAQLAVEYGVTNDQQLVKAPHLMPTFAGEMPNNNNISNSASMPTLRVQQPTKRPMTSHKFDAEMKKKKGVTSGMKLVKPEKKTDDVNLDLTILVDANEEVRVTERAHRYQNRETRRTAIFGQWQNSNKSTSSVFVDLNELRRAETALSPANIGGPDEHQAVKTRMIGEIQQFNELLEGNQDYLSRRASGREHRQIKPGVGIGMYLRQKDPLGSVVLQQIDSAHKKQKQSISVTSSQPEIK